MERTPKLYRMRKTEGGVLMGLCAGIGAHLGIDPVVVRLATVLLTVLHYAGLAVIVVYFLFSLFVPYKPESE